MARTTLEETATFGSLTVQKHRDFTRRGRLHGDGRHRDLLFPHSNCPRPCAHFSLLSLFIATRRSYPLLRLPSVIGFARCSPRLRQIWLATLTFEPAQRARHECGIPAVFVPCASGRTTASSTKLLTVQKVAPMTWLFSPGLRFLWEIAGLRWDCVAFSVWQFVRATWRLATAFLHDFLSVHPRR